MSCFLQHPRLPDSPVRTALVSGEFPWLKDALDTLGITAIQTEEERRLPKPVRFHPDLQVSPLYDKQMFVLKRSPLNNQLVRQGFSVSETERCPEQTYPKDVLCGCLVWNSYLIGNPRGVDPAIQEAAQKQGLQFLPVGQGYCACSVALVDANHAITADRGLERALKAEGFEVLLIRPGFIELPGYDTGFIGGCSGKLAPDKMAFAGQLSSHPDGELIRAFLKSQGISAVELRKGPLLDVGGILPLLQGEVERDEKIETIIQNKYFV